MIAKKYVHSILNLHVTQCRQKIALTPTGENHTRKTFSQSEKIVQLEIYLTLVICIFVSYATHKLWHYTLTMHLYYVPLPSIRLWYGILSSYSRYMKCPTFTVLYFKCIIQVFKVSFFHIFLCADPLVDWV